MPIIEISVKNKVAASPKGEIVCGNSDYQIKFAFDDEWAAYDVKTARFSYGGKFVDVIFNGDTCAAPVISGTTVCAVGVFAGDLHTTTPALVSCAKSILCNEGTPADPAPDVYAQIMERLNNLDGDNVKYTEQELTAAQQAQARENIGVSLDEYAKFTDLASVEKAGVVKVNNTSGIRLNAANGILFLDMPSAAEIQSKAQGSDAPLRIRHVDEIVRTGITKNAIALTDEEKQAAKDWLGVTEGGGGNVNIPETLPNPHKLTFTGVVSAEYDGSEAVEVNIPEGGEKDTEIITLADITAENDIVIAMDDTDDISIGDAVVSHRHFFYKTPEGEQLKAKRIYGYIYTPTAMSIPASVSINAYYQDGDPGEWSFGDDSTLANLTNSMPRSISAGNYFIFQISSDLKRTASGITSDLSWQKIGPMYCRYDAMDKIFPHISGIKLFISSGSFTFLPAGARFVLKAEVEADA